MKIVSQTYRRNQTGFVHLLVLLPVLVVLVVAVIGVKLLTASHADSCYSSGVSSTAVSGGTCPPTTSGVSQPKLAKHFATLLFSGTAGTVYGCQDGSGIVMKVTTNDGIRLSWWYESNKATNYQVPANSTVYRRADYAGYHFAATLFAPGHDGYSPATMKIYDINQCN